MPAGLAGPQDHPQARHPARGFHRQRTDPAGPRHPASGVRNGCLTFRTTPEAIANTAIALLKLADSRCPERRGPEHLAAFLPQAGRQADCRKPGCTTHCVRTSCSKLKLLPPNTLSSRRQVFPCVRKSAPCRGAGTVRCIRRSCARNYFPEMQSSSNQAALSHQRLTLGLFRASQSASDLHAA
jgi:hypothetical protein